MWCTQCKSLNLNRSPNAFEALRWLTRMLISNPLNNVLNSSPMFKGCSAPLLRAKHSRGYRGTLSLLSLKFWSSVLPQNTQLGKQRECEPATLMGTSVNWGRDVVIKSDISNDVAGYTMACIPSIWPKHSLKQPKPKQRGKYILTIKLFEAICDEVGWI